MSGLKATIAGFALTSGVAKALTVKVDQAVKLVDKGKTGEALDMLSVSLAGQIADLEADGTLTTERESTLTGAVQQLVLYIQATR